jgi:hypothetical protein
MGYNTFLSYCSIINIPCYLPTHEEIRQRLLNLWSNIMLCVLFSSCVLKYERKESKAPNNFDLMLEARVANSKKSPMLSSMRDSKEGLKCISSLALKLMVMAKFKASNNNQSTIDWFKTSINNMFQIINYCLTNEPCNRKRNMVRHLNISLFVVTHDNSSIEKKRFLG